MCFRVITNRPPMCLTCYHQSSTDVSYVLSLIVHRRVTRVLTRFKRLKQQRAISHPNVIAIVLAFGPQLACEY